MVMKKDRRHRDVKSKLMAAVCMLLVSTIMLMSSTYAWFTLSTAPEVTGITTSVGANGNLEMALLPSDKTTVPEALAAITSEAGDGAATKTMVQKNVTWGNLVTLSDPDDATNGDYYGLNHIVLYPSALNETDGAINIGSGILSYPQYGSDGRISALSSGTVTGLYDSEGGAFMPTATGTNAYGVRAVGAVSGMTDRQVAYRNASSAADGFAGKAKSTAREGLRTYGPTLAAVAVAYGLNGSSATYTQADVAAIDALIVELQEAQDYVEKAYLQYLLTYAASAATADEENWKAVKLAIEGGATLATIDAIAPGVLGSTAGITAHQTAVTALDNAAAAVDALGTKDSYTWDEIRTALDYLMNTSNVTVCGYTIAEIRGGNGELTADEVQTNIMAAGLGGTLSITIATGAGAPADVADQSGDYQAGITANVSVTAGGNPVPVPMTMYIDSTLDNATGGKTYLAAAAAVATAQQAPSESTEAKPISETYGYIADLAFRTNAYGSNLQLQVTPADRIYSDNTNTDTMGGGSTMIFTHAEDLTDEKAIDLAKCIRIMFFDPATGAIKARAKLDATKAATNGDGLEIPMSLYKIETTTTGTGNDAVTTSEEVLLTDNTIMALDQNVATALSVLVYLDGEHVTNADVSAKGTSSLTGTLNLQFSSSETLVPMENADLHITNGSGTQTGGGNGGGNTEHTTHTADTAAGLKYDATGHWYECTGEGCSEKVDFAAHTEGVACDTCDYTGQ